MASQTNWLGLASLTGTCGSASAVARVGGSGRLDTSLGGDGTVVEFVTGIPSPHIAIQHDRKMVELMQYWSGYGYSLRLCRRVLDGTLDITLDVSIGPITISPTTVNPGDTVTYTIPVKNFSTVKAAHVTMKTNVPSGTSYVGTSAPSGWAVLQQPSSGAMGAVSASAYELAPGATANLFVLVKVPATAAHGSTVSMSAVVSNTITEIANNNTAYKVFNVQ